jgi:hypothetical protein
MIKFLRSVSDHEYAPLSTVEEVSAASSKLNILSARCSELSTEIARMRQLMEWIAQTADPNRSEDRAHRDHRSTVSSGSPNHRRRPTTGGNFRAPASNTGSTHPVRSELARACRIALMETNEPASVEAIYDRIKRRGSFTFARYKHPFRSIVLAMSAMVKSGEVSLLNDAGRRRWRWERERTSSDADDATTPYFFSAEGAI